MRMTVLPAYTTVVKMKVTVQDSKTITSEIIDKLSVAACPMWTSSGVFKAWTFLYFVCTAKVERRLSELRTNSESMADKLERAEKDLHELKLEESGERRSSTYPTYDDVSDESLLSDDRGRRHRRDDRVSNARGLANLYMTCTVYPIPVLHVAYGLKQLTV
jgi:hypothetical protein